MSTFMDYTLGAMESADLLDLGGSSKRKLGPAITYALFDPGFGKQRLSEGASKTCLGVAACVLQ